MGFGVWGLCRRDREWAVPSQIAAGGTWGTLALVLLLGLPALAGAGLSDAVTDPLMLAAQTHRSPPNHLEIGRAGQVSCEALVGGNDAAPTGSFFPRQRCQGGWRQLACRCLASSKPSPEAVSFSVLSELSAGFVAAVL